MRRLLALLAAAVLLAACAGPQGARPAPVLEGGAGPGRASRGEGVTRDGSPAVRLPGPATTASPSAAGPDPAPPERRRGPRAGGAASSGEAAALRALAAAAARERAAGRHERAAALLERALRIAPRSPSLWHRLAEVRLAQGDSRLALTLAERALGLYRDDPAGQAACWRTIAAAQRRLGNRAAARAAAALAGRLAQTREGTARR